MNPRQPDPQSGALTGLSYGHHPADSVGFCAPHVKFSLRTPVYWHEDSPTPLCPSGLRPLGRRLAGEDIEYTPDLDPHRKELYLGAVFPRVQAWSRSKAADSFVNSAPRN